MVDISAYYDFLIDENNDPVYDDKPLKNYMDKWDGQAFIDKLELEGTKSVLEIGIGTGRLAMRVAPMCKDLCGIDISQKTIERAAENLSGNQNVKDWDIEAFKDLMSMSGDLDDIPENLIDAATAVSGCGPAFVYMFIEALADGGVKCGLSRDKAIKYAAQTLLGSAKMVLETGRHPEELKDAVCSPGGSTIAGVHSLEKGAFRSSAIDAVEAAYKKTQKLG